MDTSDITKLTGAEKIFLGAIAIYAQLADVPLVANSQMRWDLAGAHLAGVAAMLPAEVVSAAQARGQAEDLWTTAAVLLLELGSRGWGM